MPIRRPFGDVQWNVPMPEADAQAIVVGEVVVYLGKEIVSCGARRSNAGKVGGERGARGFRIEIVDRLRYGADPSRWNDVSRKRLTGSWIVDDGTYIRKISG